MGAAEKLQIVNSALVLIGDEKLASLSGDGEREDLANNLYDIRLEEALGMARWRFATMQVELVRNVTDPEARWSAAYDLPSSPEVLGIHAVTVDDVPISFDRYGSQIYCNADEDADVILDYLFKPDETAFAKRFKGAFIDALAADFALPKSGTLHDRLSRRAEAKFTKAAGLEAQERTARKLPTHRFTQARAFWHRGSPADHRATVTGGSTGGAVSGGGGGGGGGATTAADVSYDNTTSGLSAADVQAALDELDVAIDANIAAIAAITVLDQADEINYDNATSLLTATDVQAAIDEVEDRLDSAEGSIAANTTAINLKANLNSPALTGVPTAPTAAGGTNTTQIATTAFVQAAVSPAFTFSYESTGQTITSSGNLSLTHSLGSRPILMQFFLECTTADIGYSIGDIVPIEPGGFDTGNNQGMSVVVDATDIVIEFGSDANVFRLVRPDTNADADATNGSWELIVHAWA